MLLIAVTVSLDSGVIVRVSDPHSRGRGFDSGPFHFYVTTLGKFFMYMYHCHQAVKLVRAKGDDAVWLGR